MHPPHFFVLLHPVSIIHHESRTKKQVLPVCPLRRHRMSVVGRPHRHLLPADAVDGGERGLYHRLCGQFHWQLLPDQPLHLPHQAHMEAVHRLRWQPCRELRAPCGAVQPLPLDGRQRDGHSLPGHRHSHGSAVHNPPTGVYP